MQVLVSGLLDLAYRFTITAFSITVGAHVGAEEAWVFHWRVRHANAIETREANRIFVVLIEKANIRDRPTEGIIRLE